MDDYSHYETAETALRCRESRAYQQLASEAARVGRELHLPEHEFHNSVTQLGEAYGEFLYATNNYKVEPENRVHWYNRYGAVRLSKKLGEPEITQEVLSQAAYNYLRGLLRVPMLDRGLLDAFIAQETFAFIDRAAGRGAFLTQFGCFGVIMAGPIIWALFFDDAGVDWTRWDKVIGGLLIFFLVYWAWPRKGPYALHREMRDTYQLLTGSVVSVAELRRRVERARDRGVVWPAELYAVLDDVESRTKFV